MTSGRATAGGPLERFMTKFDAVKNVRLTEPRAFEAIAEAVGLDQAASDSSPAASDALVNAYEIFGASFEDVGSVYGVLDAINISARSAIEARQGQARVRVRSEEHTSELQSLMRISYAVFCLKKKTHTK